MNSCSYVSTSLLWVPIWPWIILVWAKIFVLVSFHFWDNPLSKSKELHFLSLRDFDSWLVGPIALGLGWHILKGACSRAKPLTSWLVRGWYVEERKRKWLVPQSSSRLCPQWLKDLLQISQPLKILSVPNGLTEL